MKARTMYKSGNTYKIYRAEIKNPKSEYEKNVTYDFTFSVVNENTIKINVLFNMSDCSEYALVKLDKLSVKALYSYNDYALRLVEAAVKNVGLTTQFLKKVVAQIV